MRVLAISSIFPIPGIKEENDIVSAIYRNLELHYPEIKIFRCMPVPYVPPMVERLPIHPMVRKYAVLNRHREFQHDGKVITILGGLMVRSPLFLRYYTMKLFYRMIRRRLLEVVKVHQPDVIHANYVNLDGFFAFRLHQETGIPYVVTGRSKEFNFTITNKYKKLFRQVLSAAAGITALNSTSANVIRTYTSKPIHLIPHGLDDHFFDPSFKYRRKNSVIRLLSVGNLLHNKNLDKVIIALGRLKTEGLPFEYTIVGKGPVREELNRLTEENGIQSQTKFVDAVPYEKMPEFYRKFDIFVMPSKPEAFGRVFFEAMAAGIPVICADEWGINGFYEQEVSAIGVDPQDIDTLAAWIKNLHEYPHIAEGIGQAGTKAARKYRWPNVSRMYKEALTVTL